MRRKESAYKNTEDLTSSAFKMRITTDVNLHR